MTIDEIKELYKMIAERDDSIGDLISKIADKDTRIAELEAQVEHLKCCGNCGGGYTTSEDRHFCARYLKLTKASCYCSSWQSDGLTRKEREGNYCSKWQSDNLTRKERE